MMINKGSANNLTQNIHDQLSESEKLALNKSVSEAEKRYFENKATQLKPQNSHNSDDVNMRPAVEWAIAVLPIPVILAAMFLELYAVYAASVWAISSAVLILFWAQTQHHQTQAFS